MLYVKRSNLRILAYHIIIPIIFNHIIHNNCILKLKTDGFIDVLKLIIIIFFSNAYDSEYSKEW